MFAVPGRTTDSQSEGCNNLIKQQKAYLLSTPLDVPYLLNWQLEDTKKPSIQKQLFVTLTEDEQLVYNFLKSKDKEQLDIIAINCKLPTYRLAGILVTMELKGVLRPLPGKLFELI